MKIIILAGGGGSRLFPLSRSCYPKQFLSIAGENSLLVQTIERYLHVVDARDIVIITNQDYIFHVQAELKKIHADDAHIIAEPIGRNTAPAIALGMAYCKDELQTPEDEVLFVGPSDHVIKPVDAFANLIKQNVELAEQGNIVTLGITPTTPETGYGYIEAKPEKVDNAFKVNSFREKPNRETAAAYLAQGNYYWNSGMFMFTIETMEKELNAYAPAIQEIAAKGYQAAVKEFAAMPEISIDYAVAERSQRIVVAPMSGIYWNDIGSFDAIYDMLKDKEGNVIRGDTVIEGCSDSMILGDKRLIAGIGLKDIMIVDTPDALLVARRGESQKVKNIVNRLKEEKRPEAVSNVTMYRPWGSYTILAEGPGYKVKRICVNPGQSLSLQMHYHRSEHWMLRPDYN